MSTVHGTPPERTTLRRRIIERRNRYIAERRLPRFSERPFDWSTNLVHTLVYRIAFAHVGKLAVIAAYYLLTQTLTAQHTTIFHTVCICRTSRARGITYCPATSTAAVWSILCRSARGIRSDI